MVDADLQLDGSQSPYFSVGFSRLVRFDGTATILVCESKRDLGRVSKLPRGAGVGVSIVREGKQKNRDCNSFSPSRVQKASCSSNGNTSLVNKTIAVLKR